MKITNRKMISTIEENLDFDSNKKVRCGLVKVSDGKSKPVVMRLYLTLEQMRLQEEIISPVNNNSPNTYPKDASIRLVVVNRDTRGNLGISIKGGAEHKLPILISKIIKGQSAHLTGLLFVGDAIIKVNGELINHCTHEEAINIIHNAGDMVMLTVKHYASATPFLSKTVDNNLSNIEETIQEPLDNEKMMRTTNNIRPSTLDINYTAMKKWSDVITVPLLMAYITRYMYGTDKLRPNAFEIRGLNGSKTGIIHCEDSAILSQWLKYINDNIMALSSLQIKLFNRNYQGGDRIEYMGWVNEGILNRNTSWQNYRPRFLVLKGTEVFIFETPPLTMDELNKCKGKLKVYQSMLRIIKDSENVDERQHCFLLQTCGENSKYFSVETRHELLRIESAWHTSICTSVIKIGTITFNVVCSDTRRNAGLTLNWNHGFSLYDTTTREYVWRYKFSNLRGSSDDGKSKLKLHFYDPDSKAIETKALECIVLQGLLFCMHAFLTAKVASVDPSFLSVFNLTC
uniref:Gamma-1-syntrophin n=2 Tax=Cacopsylla melanoneura TaxID=428564 RepID=A0A8D8YVP5_9HEMI